MARRRRRRRLPSKPWTMLAYIAGDNDLSDNGLEDIQEMCDVGASRATHVGVQIDTEGEHDGAVRYEISEPDPTGEAHRIVIERLDEPDSGNPEVLYEFLRWGLRRYPARRRLAVVWNHGAGFRTAPRRDIAYDDYGTSLDMNELQGALRRAGIRGQSRLAVLGFDACLMNMLEIVYQLRRESDFIVGSQQTEPGDGWPYDQVMRAMNAGPTPERLARRIVAVYMRECRAVGDTNVTQSAVRTARAAAAMTALSRLGAALVAAMGAGHTTALRRARSAVQAYDYADYVDAVHLGQLLAQIRDPAVQARAQALAAAVQRCVVVSDHDGRAVRNSNGLSIWFPASRRLYLEFRSVYTALDFWPAFPGWVRFLDAFHS